MREVVRKDGSLCEDGCRDRIVRIMRIVRIVRIVRTEVVCEDGCLNRIVRTD